MTDRVETSAPGDSGDPGRSDGAGDSAAPDAASVHEDAGPSPASPTEQDRRPRPMLERLGMAAIALVLGAMFALVGVAAFAGGEPFLGAMGLIGCLMVMWVGGLTLFKGR